VLPGSDQWRIVLTTPTQPAPDMAADSRTLLVVDQFEELFTARSSVEQVEYADWLAGAVARDHVTVVVVVRSDYFAPAAAHPRLSDLLAANTVLVGEMTPDELRQAVELPAAAAGLELETGLAETIGGEVVGEPGGLPLMSTALLSLWERRDGRRLSLAAYHQVGGVRTAVARLAETAYGQLTPNRQAVARRILLRLAETGEGGGPVRRRVPIGEVAPEGDADARAVLDALAARRLLTVSDTHAEVAHEALLREWPRLRTWLDEDEAGRKLRRHLAPTALAWQTSGDAGELYRGARLAAALDWQRDHPNDLTQVEHDFLRTSRDAAEAETLGRRRSIRRLRTFAIGLAIVTVLAVVVSLVAVNLRNAADRSSLRADVRGLHTRALTENRLDRALLYAAQAEQFEGSTDSRAALLETMQRSPEATAILNADQPLDRVTTTADGSKVVASGTDGTVYIWDTASRLQIQTIPGAALSVTSLDVSPDGRYIAAVGLPVSEAAHGQDFDEKVVLIDLEQSPPSVRVLEGDDPSSAVFAADSRTIVTASGDGHVRYIDIGTGVVQHTREFGVAGLETGRVGWSPNQRFMVAADPAAAGMLAVWDVEAGNAVFSSRERDATVAAISPDGSTLVLGHADGRIEQVDLDSGGDRVSIQASLNSGLVDLAWSMDGTKFAGATQERSVIVWDARTLQAETILRGHSGAVTNVVFSSDSNAIYASGLDRSVLAWDLTGSKGIAAVTSPVSADIYSEMAPDRSVVATWFFEDGRLQILEVAEGTTFDIVVDFPAGEGPRRPFHRPARPLHRSHLPWMAKQKHGNGSGD
jgi:WD40 repeat protein